MKAIVTILRILITAMLFLFGAAGLLVATINSGDGTGEVIAQGVVGAGLLMVAIAFIFEEYLRDIRSGIQRQNELLEEQVRLTKYLSSNTYRDKLAQRKEVRQK